MRTKVEIDAEIKALKALPPTGKFKAKIQNAIIQWIIEELEDGVDSTAEEWNEMTCYEQESVFNARLWKEGVHDKKPSEGWGGL